jgi:hypothetical protein
MSWKVEQQADREDQIIPPLLQTPVIGWTQDNGTFYFRPPITTNFVSSFMDCGMEQTVDLSEVLRLNSNSNNNQGHLSRGAHIEVSARYTGRTDCPSVFALQAILWNDDPTARQRERSNNNRHHQRRIRPTTLPQELSSGILEAPPGVYWERTSLEFALDTITSGTEWNHPMVTVRVFGKDRRFWQGNFGSKVADITVRVVGGTAEEIDALVKAPGEVPEELGGDNFDGDNNNEAAARDNDGGVSRSADPSRSTISPQPGTKAASLWGLDAGVVVLGVLFLSWLFSKGS